MRRTSADSHSPGTGYSDFGSIGFFLPLLCLSILLSAPGSAHGQNASVRDYTVPVSSARNLQVDFAFTYSATGPTVTSKNGNLLLFYRKFYDSLPFAYAMDLNGSAILAHSNPAADFNQTGKVDGVDASLLASYLYLRNGLGAARADSSRYAAVFDLNRDGRTDVLDAQAFQRMLGETASDDVTYNSLVSGRAKKYLRNGSRVFGFGDFNFRHSDTFHQPDIDVTPGLGFGRFISATPLAKAVRIEEFLLREGAIKGHMPREHLVGLGHVIQREGEFRERYGGTYRKWWFEAMETVIVASGVAPGGIEAGGILRINEVLFEQRVNERFYGWETTAGTNFQLTQPVQGLGRRKPGAAIGLRYALPFGWKHQVSGRLDLTTPFTGQFGKVYKLTFSQDYLYEVSNRIDFILRDIFTIDNSPSFGTTPLTNHQFGNTLSSAFVFFIENKTNFSVTAQLDKTESRPIFQSFAGTLNYRIF